MFKTLGRITEWGWKKGQSKQEALIKQATRDTPFQHKMYQINPWWTLIMLALMFGMITVAFAFIGHPFYKLIESVTIGGEGVTTIGLAVYGFYLFWLLPAILWGATLAQLILFLLPKVGNTFTGTDMVKALAEMEGDTKLLKKAIEFKVSKEVVLEKTTFIDLNYVRRHACVQMGKGAMIITLIFLPFMYLSINTHFSKLADDTLVYSSFLQLGTETIEIENIDMVTVDVDWEDDHLEPYYEIDLNDGRSIDLWELGIAAPDIEDVITIATHLKQQDVYHFIIPLPNLDTLNDWTKDEFNYFYQTLKAL